MTDARKAAEKLLDDLKLPREGYGQLDIEIVERAFTDFAAALEAEHQLVSLHDVEGFQNEARLEARDVIAAWVKAEAERIRQNADRLIGGYVSERGVNAMDLAQKYDQCSRAIRALTADDLRKK